MREILFRGKRIDNGEWVYGFLYETEKSSSYNAESYILEKARLTINYKCVEGITTHIPFVQVTPDTVGQYTGLTDKNGTKIFEGDIVLKSDARFGKEPFVVFWDDFECILQWKVGQKTKISYPGNQTLEVIGNTHDNPELLEDKE